MSTIPAWVHSRWPWAEERFKGSLPRVLEWKEGIDGCMFVYGAALFSPCRVFRYTLLRDWDRDLPMMAYLMLNPSKATARKPDNTCNGCMFREIAGGEYGAMTVLNLWPYRATDPSELHAINKQHPGKPEMLLGQYANFAILKVAATVDRIVIGWGNHGTLLNRGARVLSLLKKHGHWHKLRAFAVTQKGQPQHPLYVPRARVAEPWPKVLGEGRFTAPPDVVPYQEGDSYDGEIAT